MDKNQLYELAAAKACGRHDWAKIGDALGLTWQAARGHWRRKCQKFDPAALPPCSLCAGTSTQPQQSWAEQGNYATGSARIPGPLSLPEFLKLLQVDEKVWKVKDWAAQRWPAVAKVEVGELTFDEGRISGHLSKQGPAVQDLWLHKASFIRHQPIAVAPVIQPVACPVTFPIQPTPRGKGHRALLLSDLHIGYERDNRTGKLTPFHDRLAIGAMFQAVESYRAVLDAVLILGDLLDFTNWNDKFSRQPAFYWTTQPAILEAHWVLRRLRELVPFANVVFLAGNHEDRMRNAVEKHLIEAYDLRAADEMDLPPSLSPARLLALHSLGIEWVDDERWLGPLRCSHGEVARKPPGASTRAVVEDTACDNAFGHTHRLEMVSKTIRVREGTKQVSALSTGCLCHTDGRVPGSGLGDNWQQGLALIDYNDKIWTPTLAGVQDGRIVLGGRELIGHDYTDLLRQDLPDWNW